MAGTVILSLYQILLTCIIVLLLYVCEVCESFFLLLLIPFFLLFFHKSYDLKANCLQLLYAITCETYII
jgi:hypothetical protein